MKHIVKYLSPFLTVQCGQVLPEGSAMADLHAIAIDHPAGETIKVGYQVYICFGAPADYIIQLLRLVLLVAISCQRRSHYIERITTLSTSTQMALMKLISEVFIAEQSKYQPS